jgi:hypothetical protein
MPATSVIGAQWGDEGKGKIIDLIADRADVVVRFQGGANANRVVEGRSTSSGCCRAASAPQASSASSGTAWWWIPSPAGGV